MSFRRKLNRADIWKAVTEENRQLLAELPPEALQSERRFRDYVTSGIHASVRFLPPVEDLSPRALEDLSTFINRKAQFDMDAILFENFKSAYRRAHLGDSNAQEKD